MAASSRGSRALRDAFRAPSVCSRCATGLPRTPIRFYSASVVTETSSTTATTPPLSTQPTQPPKTYEIRSGMIVTRPPLLTRNLHPFEEAFFFYQKRLEERLNTPFVKSIYFKPDTPRQLDWDMKIKERQGSVARELGVYQGKSSKAWDDELKVGDELSTQESMLKSMLKDAESRVSDDAEIIPESEIVPVPRPNDRVTEADKKGDTKRLDRQLDRTLYLVVKGKEGWCFPADTLKDENLHEAAKRVMDQAAGINMNTWVVGRVPVAHLVTRPKLDAGGKAEPGRKTFFLRARIMAGQANLADNPFGYTDFKWLTREELEKVLDPEYFQGVRYMMADR
ncbi:39S mitochondrial ribosomal protein L46-domain-containing protein [Stachybotrys elegans]|uniref:Large ribosomal subunit protein mL46 n=1 Tax=Stachybotrys elegans TaxID=80388 RepID=A0A8K0T2R4_9HYPO|nr:39S mitochondrial ribosomal protein L46-domain-containing protein [Stachybotrys elegans]